MNNPNAGIPYLAPAPERQGMNVQAFTHNFQALQQRTALAKANKEAQNRKAWNDNFDPSKIAPKEIYDHNAKVIDRDIAEYSELQAQGEAAGYDVDNNRMPPEYKAKLAAAQAKINQHVTTGRENQQILEMYQKAFTDHPDKYNIEDLYKFNEGFKKIDPLDPTAQNEYLRNNNPIKEDIHIVDLLKDWMGEPDTIESTGGVTVTELPPDKVKERITTNFLSQPKDKQNQMIDKAMSLADDQGHTPVTDLNTAIDFMTETALKLGEKKVTRVKEGGSGDGSGSGRGKLEEVTTIGGDGNGITTFVSPNETLPTLTFVDEKGDGYASEKYIAKRNANGNVYAVEVEVSAKKPTPPDTSDIDDKLNKLNAITPKNKSEEANIESQKKNASCAERENEYRV